MEKEKVTIELEVSDAQEVLSTITTMVKKLMWIFENQMPNRPDLLRDRILHLNNAAVELKRSLNDRALEIQNSKAPAKKARTIKKGNVVSIKQ